MTSPIKSILLAIVLAAGFQQMPIMSGIANSQSMSVSKEIDVLTIVKNALRGDAKAIERLQKLVETGNLRLMVGKPNPLAVLAYSATPVDVKTPNHLQSDSEIGNSPRVSFMDSESTHTLGSFDKLPPESLLLPNMKSTGQLQQAVGQENLQTSPSSEKQSLSEMVAKAKKGDPASLKGLHMEAEMGNLQASYQLGLLYETGQGVDQNLDIASRLYQQTIEEGIEFLARGLYHLRNQ